MTPAQEHDHDNLVMDRVMPLVGAPWVTDQKVSKKERRLAKKQRPRRGDGTVAGH